ncbi:MAG TPA: hypothetical protein VGM98_24000, partial [Schlesneria sp.]
LEGQMSICLMVGGNFITILPAGIFINGMPLVNINSGGASIPGIPGMLESPIAPGAAIEADKAVAGSEVTYSKDWDSPSAAGAASSAGASAAPSGSALGRADGIVLEGSAADKKTLSDLVEKIRKSGPKGKAFIEALEKGPTKTHLFVAKSAEKKDGTVVQLKDTGGGLTLRPTESKSGDNEVFVDPTNLIDYNATDGSTAKEKPEGLLLHEMGHAKLLNDKDPDQTSGGANAEKNVRTETNPIREEMGMKPEK